MQLRSMFPIGFGPRMADTGVDDVLDAAAAAWSACRILNGQAKSLPDPPEVVDGYPVAVWY
jgi:predicted RNase H-like nuclease